MINYHMNLSRLFEHLAHLKGLVAMIDTILCLHVIPNTFPNIGEICFYR